MKYRILFLFLLSATVATAQNLPAEPAQLKSDGARQAVEMIERVNAYWQSHNRAECRGFWDNAAYFTGNQAAYELTGRPEYLAYALRFAEHNRWSGATERNKQKWEYKTYGEDMRHVLFADWQICFQIYIDLYKLEHRAERLQRTLEVMNYQARTSERDY